MRYFIILLIILSLFSGCASSPDKKETSLDESSSAGKSSQIDPAAKISETIVINIYKVPSKKVAVVDFTDIEGNETTEGKLLAEQIITYLAQNTNVQVIERKQLGKMLEEQKLSLSGLTEGENTDKVGKLLNVDGLVLGSITELENSKEINARMVNPDTGVVICAVPVKLEEEDKMSFKNISDEDKKKLNKEYEEIERERKENPELYKFKSQHRQQLLKLREKDPELFRQVVKTIQQMERIKIEKPRLFLLITEPKDSPKIKQLARNNPKRYNDLREFRKKLKFIVDHSPAYKDKLMRERQILIDRMSR